MSDVLNRFLKYVSICTSSDEESDSFPSTHSQIVFGNMLKEECEAIGLKNAEADKYGYISALLPSNISSDVPSVCFIAHMDTSPDASGFNIRPVLTENYDGQIIQFKERKLDPAEFPELRNYIGDTIISSDGTTLLGADDKAGIAEIMTAMEYIINNNIPHGDIRVLFTPDEEIGKGVDFLDVKKLGCDFGYTLDGGAVGELEFENFNAASAEIYIKGKSVHPGSAKGIMINAADVASKFASSMPANETPGTTEGYEGFFHLHAIKGTVSDAELDYIIRDFDAENFEKRKLYIKEKVNQINSEYGNIAECIITEQYSNMFEIMKDNMHIVELAKKSMEEIGIIPKIQPIRGGTDGARLSFMGLPCPNIFAGGHNFHGPYEFIPLSSMEKAVELIVKIAENIAK